MGWIDELEINEALDEIIKNQRTGIEQIIDAMKILSLNDEQRRNAAVAIQGLHKSHKDKIYDEYINKTYTKKFLKSLNGKYFGYVYKLQKDWAEEVVDTYPL